MAGLRRNLLKSLFEENIGSLLQSRPYCSNVDIRNLQPMIRMKVENRSKVCRANPLSSVADEVLKARTLLIQGVSKLLEVIPILACKYCSEVYVGEKGHLIKSCWGYKRIAKRREHEWVPGGLNDILVSLETRHFYNTMREANTSNRSLDHVRVPAVVELCWQAGAEQNFEVLHPTTSSGPEIDHADVSGSPCHDELRWIAMRTLQAWEAVREGVKKLLYVHPAKTCKLCLEVRVGRTKHAVQWLRGVSKHEDGGAHLWKKAEVDDLVPPKVVWHRRPHDPVVLVHENREYYGRTPAVVDLCTRAGAVAPAKYLCMMKGKGLSGPVSPRLSEIQEF